MLMLNVATGKSTAVILDPATVAEFMVSNPSTLRKVEGIDPVGYIPNTLSVLNTETQLLNLLNVGVMGMHAYGDADTIFKQYEAKYKGGTIVFFRPTMPFKPN
jgi:hypothetical protein